jgi:hypothetical protein
MPDYKDLPRHGFGFSLKWISETSPWTMALICSLAVVALALLIIPWNSIFPPGIAVPVQVAHVQPAPSPSPAAQVVQVNGGKGAICVVPTSKVKGLVEVVKVP